MSVINHDFGGPKRGAARRLRKMLSLDAMHEANVRSNPMPYLERASERIFQLESALFEANQAGVEADAASVSEAKVRISENEYQRLLRCRAIVAAAFARLVETENDDA